MLRALTVLLLAFGLFIWLAARYSFAPSALASAVILLGCLLPGYLLWRFDQKRRRSRAAELAARSINP